MTIQEYKKFGLHELQTILSRYYDITFTRHVVNDAMIWLSNFIVLVMLLDKEQIFRLLFHYFYLIC